MRIVINCRSILLKNRTGIGRYTYHLLDQLGAIDPKNEYCLYARKDLFDFKRKLPQFNYPNFKKLIDILQRPVPLGDVYHVPCPADIDHFEGKVVVTIHDLIYKTYPQSHTQETIDLSERAMQGIVKRADKIICISESTRNDLHRFFDYPKENSCVVLNGVDHSIFYPLQDPGAAKSFLSAQGISGEFLLFVGTIEPRKNLMGLLEAMALLKHPLPLVVVGMKGWMTEDIIPKIKQLGLEGRVIFTGFISDAELNMLYNTCKAFVFPSFYEGFGFPIVEAFAAGACVIASFVSSCGEIAEDAAVLINPNSPAHIAQAIDSVLGDSALNAAYKAKGLRRGQEFSFRRTAKDTLSIYQTLGGREC